MSIQSGNVNHNGTTPMQQYDCSFSAFPRCSVNGLEWEGDADSFGTPEDEPGLLSLAPPLMPLLIHINSAISEHFMRYLDLLAREQLAIDALCVRDFMGASRFSVRAVDIHAAVASIRRLKSVRKLAVDRLPSELWNALAMVPGLTIIEFERGRDPGLPLNVFQ